MSALPVTVRVIVLKKTGSSAEGIDISEVAIINALELAAKLAADDHLRYKVSDTCSLPFYAKMFTYVLGGCNFSFIQARERVLSEVSRVLKVEGDLCTLNFYYRRTPSDKIITDVYSAIGFEPDPASTLHYWHDFFGQSRIGTGSRKNYDLSSRPYDELKENFRRYIRIESAFTCQLEENMQDAAFYERYLVIRASLNAQRD
ncbi:class I SAM-dependent methyltransferase [Bartonella gabonensis]|uniref:class I SAM-dependent methyltransferase n=1 Tax=Bartonella gabonensis TaxID=2699889 RepID=UPI001AEE385B|nr:methyltransferase domain-containing protein [Bartonella gabonensis]